MHKDFYASGFLFHLPTQQILLQQIDTSSGMWSLFGGEKKSSSLPNDVFKKIIRQKLKIALLTDLILPVYDYFHTGLRKTHFILYAPVDREIHKIKPSKKNPVAWFTFKQLYKLPLSQQTRQDLIVGERVIKAQQRSVSEANLSLS